MSNKISATINNSKLLVKYMKKWCTSKQLSTQLKQSIGVRWDSKYAMLDSIHKNFTQLRAFIV